MKVLRRFRLLEPSGGRAGRPCSSHQGEEALAAFTRSPLGFKAAAVRRTRPLDVKKQKKHVHYKEREDSGEAACLERKRTPPSPPLPCSYMEEERSGKLRSNGGAEDGFD